LKRKVNTRQLQAIETKKRIYDVTKMLVDTYGIEGVSIRRITKKANISTGTFYRYYSSKDEVIYSMLIYISNKFLDEIKNDLRGDTYSEMLYDFVVRDMKFKSRYTKLYKDTLRQILQSKKGDYKFSDYLFSDSNKGYNFTRHLVVAAKKANEFSADISTDDICAILQSITWGLTDLCSMDVNFDIVNYTSRIANTLLGLFNTGNKEKKN